MPPGNEVGIGLTRGVDPSELGGGDVAGEVDLLLGGDLDLDLESPGTFVVKSVGDMFSESRWPIPESRRILLDSLPTMESMENPSLDLDWEELAAELATAAA